ncbi:hypothetical protein [Streptomyces sp. NPDC093707]|uniref:hypothetical protein n=1 Tax=Streptomyces sp. NPDC093707 TaxID=3154984 RepID=UPI00344BC882
MEAVPLDQLRAPARTYLRTAPLLTRSQAPAALRAALLESAFVEDGLLPYAEALHGLGLNLPWRTLWSLPLPGVASVTTGVLPSPEGSGRPVATLVVPAEASTITLVHDLLRPGYVDADPAQVLPPRRTRAPQPRTGSLATPTT